MMLYPNLPLHILKLQKHSKHNAKNKALQILSNKI